MSPSPATARPPGGKHSPACQGGATSNCWHFRRRMLTSLACRGATFCFTWIASFLVFVHCSGSSYSGQRPRSLPFPVPLNAFHREIAWTHRQLQM